MSLSVTAKLDLDPKSIQGEQPVTLRYSIGSTDVTRACDRIVVGGADIPGRECFDVRGTVAVKQVEKRRITVQPPAGIELITVEVFVQEVDADNRPIGSEKRAANNLRIKI